MSEEGDNSTQARYQASVPSVSTCLFTVVGVNSHVDMTSCAEPRIDKTALVLSSDLRGLLI